jgi:hypothetical protein
MAAVMTGHLISGDVFYQDPHSIVAEIVTIAHQVEI